MAEITKPVYGEIWASDGEKITPELSKITGGWIQEMMPFQYENWIQNRQDVAISYLLQAGVPEWDINNENIANKTVVQYQGNLYMATTTNTGVLPSVQASWSRLTPATNQAGVVTLASGGTGATTAPAARTALGLGSIATQDSTGISVTGGSLDGVTIGATTAGSGRFTNVSASGTITANSFIGAVTGNATSANKLTTARLIGGVSFDGTSNIDLPGVNVEGNQNTTGNAASATRLETARTINGVSFNGTGNITVADSTKLPLTGGSLSGSVTMTNGSGNYVFGNSGGVLRFASGTFAAENAALDLNADKTATFYGGITAPSFTGNLIGNVTGGVSGNAGTATRLATARLIGGVSFNGTADINLPGVNVVGNQDTTGNAATADSLKTARTISLSGGATGTATSFNGTANIIIPVTSLDANQLTAGQVPTARLGNAVTKTATTGAAYIPVGTAAQRPTGEAGMFRLNSESNIPEFYSAGQWRAFSATTTQFTGAMFDTGWFNGKRDKLPAGVAPMDGQQISAALYPDLCAAIWAGQQNAITEAEWQADPLKRNNWSTGDLTTYVRVPDMNGVQSGSGKPFYLRGGSEAFTGTAVGDAIRNITGGFATLVPNNHTLYAVGGFAAASANDTSQTTTAATYPANVVTTASIVETTRYGYKIDASKVVPTADENRVRTAYGVWWVRIFNAINNTSALDVGNIATELSTKASSESVAPAIAMAQTFTVVPTTFQASVIFVTQPHFRTFIWDGTKYVRAPWHRPGIIFHSDAPSANITHGIQLRSDVTYNVADYPDLAEVYGFTGATFVLKDARARVIRGADLGRGIDTALVNGYLQEDAIRNITGSTSRAYFAGVDVASGAFVKSVAADQPVGGGTVVSTYGYLFDASKVVPTASENRVKSLIATPYVTI